MNITNRKSEPDQIYLLSLFFQLHSFPQSRLQPCSRGLSPSNIEYTRRDIRRRNKAKLMRGEEGRERTKEFNIRTCQSLRRCSTMTYRIIVLVRGKPYINWERAAPSTPSPGLATYAVLVPHGYGPRATAAKEREAPLGRHTVKYGEEETEEEKLYSSAIPYLSVCDIDTRVTRAREKRHVPQSFEFTTNDSAKATAVQRAGLRGERYPPHVILLRVRWRIPLIHAGRQTGKWANEEGV